MQIKNIKCRQRKHKEKKYEEQRTNNKGRAIDLETSGQLFHSGFRGRTESVSVRVEINKGVNGERGSDGQTQSERPNEMGGNDEQYQSTSRGDSAERSSLYTLIKIQPQVNCKALTCGLL